MPPPKAVHYHRKERELADLSQGLRRGSNRRIRIRMASIFSPGPNRITEVGREERLFLSIVVIFELSTLLIWFDCVTTDDGHNAVCDINNGCTTRCAGE
jgi:hypothetical protein